MRARNPVPEAADASGGEADLRGRSRQRNRARGRAPLGRGGRQRRRRGRERGRARRDRARSAQGSIRCGSTSAIRMRSRLPSRRWRRSSARSSASTTARRSSRPACCSSRIRARSCAWMQAGGLDRRAVVDALDRAELRLHLLDGSRDRHPGSLTSSRSGWIRGQTAAGLGEPGLVHVRGGDAPTRLGPTARGRAPDFAGGFGHEDQLPRRLHPPPPEPGFERAFQ